VRILNDETDEPLKKISLFVTREEAEDLFASLEHHLRHEQPEQGWHAHVDSSDGREKSLSLSIYDPDDPESDAKWRSFFKDDVWTKRV
jgi:hypothetical protein